MDDKVFLEIALLQSKGTRLFIMIVICAQFVILITMLQKQKFELI